MANRTPVGSGLGRARIQPIAAPVDTYVRDQKGARLSQLAESLKGVAPEVAKYSDVAAQQQSEAQKAAGEQKAREMFESGVSYKEAIKKGLISPQDSPWFQLGAKEQGGRVAAGRFQSDLADAVQNDPKLQDSTNVADYDKFVAAFRQKWDAENIGDDNRDLHFEHGFGSMADQFSKDSRTKFVAEAGDRLVKQVGDNHYQETFTLLDHELHMGTDQKAIAQGLNLLNDRAIAMGVNPRAANVAMVRALGDIVQRDGDTSVFDILKSVKTGSGNLYSTQWAQEEIQKVTEKVYIDKQRHNNAAEAAQKEARETSTRNLMGSMTARLVNSANPSRENIDADVAALSAINPEAAQSMVRFKDTMTGAKFASNVPSVHSTLDDIFTIPQGAAGFVDEHTLVKLVNAHEINQQDFSFLKSQMDQRDEAARRSANDAREHNPYTDPQFTHAMSALKPLIGDEMTWDAEKAARINGATADFGRRWLEYVNGAGKNASALDKDKFLIETTQSVRDKWATDDVKGTVKESAPPVPTVELRTPAQREQAGRMANLMASQIRAGTGFSPGVVTFLKNNGIKPEDAQNFITKYGDKN